MADLNDALQHVPLFRDLEEDGRKQIADAMQQKEYPANACVFAEGEPGDAFYVLLKGEAFVKVSQSMGGFCLQCCGNLDNSFGTRVKCQFVVRGFDFTLYVFFESNFSPACRYATRSVRPASYGTGFANELGFSV